MLYSYAIVAMAHLVYVNNFGISKQRQRV